MAFRFTSFRSAVCDWCFFLLVLVPIQVESWGQVALEQPVSSSNSQLQFIDQVLQQHIEEKKLIGAVTWISRGGEVIHHEAHGLMDRDAQRPMRRDTLFRIHSFTKAISTTAAMMLWEEGKFQLDDPVAKYLPEFSTPRVYESSGSGELQRPMSVRDLMRHTSGVVYPNSEGNDVERLYEQAELRDIDTSLAEFAHRVARLPLEFSPGEQWKYGMSIDLLGRLIEVWAEQDFAEFLRNRLFAPLGMKDTDFFVPPAKRSRLATLYLRDDEGDLQPQHGYEKDKSNYVPAKCPVRCSPGGGLFSTASDYGTFLQMILAGGRFENQHLLQPNTIALMTSDQLPANVAGVRFGTELRDGFKFGLGFNVITARSKWDRQARVGEYGWGGAASCHYWLWPPQDLAVITLESTIPYNRNLEQALKGKIYEVLD